MVCKLCCIVCYYSFKFKRRRGRRGGGGGIYMYLREALTCNQGALNLVFPKSWKKKTGVS